MPTDAETICEWMEPNGWAKTFTGPDEKHPYHWWKWFTAPRMNMQTNTFECHHLPTDLTLDRLREVEERLTDEQWRKYADAIYAWDYAEDLGYAALRACLHATPAQKIAALAAVIRAEVSDER